MGSGDGSGASCGLDPHSRRSTSITAALKLAQCGQVKGGVVDQDVRRVACPAHSRRAADRETPPIAHADHPREEAPGPPISRLSPPVVVTRTEPRRGSPQFRIFHVSNLVCDVALDSSIRRLHLRFGQEAAITPWTRRSSSISRCRNRHSTRSTIWLLLCWTSSAAAPELLRRSFACRCRIGCCRHRRRKSVGPGDARGSKADDRPTLRLQSHDRRVPAFRHADVSLWASPPIARKPFSRMDPFKLRSVW